MFQLVSKDCSVQLNSSVKTCLEGYHIRLMSYVVRFNQSMWLWTLYYNPPFFCLLLDFTSQYDYEVYTIFPLFLFVGRIHFSIWLWSYYYIPSFFCLLLDYNSRFDYGVHTKRWSNIYWCTYFLQVGDLRVCDIAENIKNNPEYELLDDLDQIQILEILRSAGSVNYTENDFNGTARQTEMKMKKIILDHVKNKCECIL